MAIDTEVSPARNLVIQKVSGVLSMDDVKQAMDYTFNHEWFRPEMNILCEIDANSLTAITMDEVYDFVEMTRQLGAKRGTGKSALLAFDEVDIGLLQVTEVLLDYEERQTRVFRQREQALEWLGIS